MLVRDIFEKLDAWAPFATQMSFDNAGILAGDPAAEVTGVAVCFDITPDAVRRAGKAGYNLVVSHHPVIFTPVKRLPAGSAPYLLAAGQMTAICAHTNLDAAAGGVNDVLAQALQLTGIHAFGQGEGPGIPPMPRLGELPQPMEVEAFARFVKGALGCSGLRYTPLSRPVRRVAVCGGSGADFLEEAKAAGADVLVTGEARHHELLLARELDICLLDAGHFATEQKIVAEIARRLREWFPGLPVAEIRQSEPATYL